MARSPARSSGPSARSTSTSSPSWSTPSGHSISVHPGGHSHGPQPGAVERSLGVEYFDELAVMVDTFRPLDLGEAGLAVDDGKYAWTWSGRGPSA